MYVAAAATASAALREAEVAAAEREEQEAEEKEAEVIIGDDGAISFGGGPRATRSYDPRLSKPHRLLEALLRQLGVRPPA